MMSRAYVKDTGPRGWRPRRYCSASPELLVLLAVVLVSLSSSLTPSSSSPPVTPTWFGGWGSNNTVVEVWGFLGTPEFFQDYVKGGRVGGRVPVIMRGAAQASAALRRWMTDDYFLSLHVPHEQAFDMLVETKKKENRSQVTLSMDFQEFVKSYNDSEYYLVNPVPPFLLRDVVVPGPLQCKEVIETLVENIMWFSSGGTKSVVHTDAVENINCVYSGKKHIVLIDPRKYGDSILLDHPEGAFSGVDVDNVDYNKYPGLATAEFYHVDLSAGDCLYIPYRWIHQVRSYGRSIAVNIWWDHYGTRDLDLSHCPHQMDPELTLDKVHFNGFQEMMKSPNFLRDQFVDYVKNQKTKKLILDQLMSIFTSDYDGDLTEAGYGHVLPMEQIMMALDADLNEAVDLEEVKSATDEVWHVVAANIEKFDAIMETLQLEEEDFEKDEL